MGIPLRKLKKYIEGFVVKDRKWVLYAAMKTNRHWTPRDTKELVEITLRHLPAVLLASAVLVTACLAPSAMLSGMSAVAAAIKALWR
ncbi:MAG: hypothetical protein ACO1TE_28725 [Prosthecobacter sp.]